MARSGRVASPSPKTRSGIHGRTKGPPASPIADATGGAVTISDNTLTNVEGDGIHIASGANGVVVTGNDVIRGSAWRYTAQALRFDIKSAVPEDENPVPLTDLRVSGNCFLNYDGLPSNNHGAI